MIGFTASLLVKKLLVGHHVFFDIVFNTTISVRVEVLLRIVLGVGALNLFCVVFLFFAAAAPSTRLNTEHEWHANNDKDDKEKCDTFLSLEEVDILSSHFQEVVDHDRDDGRAVSEGKHWSTVHIGDTIIVCVFSSFARSVQSGVSIHWVDPFHDNEGVHPSEETVKNDQTSDNLEDEHEPGLVSDGVETLNADSHRHVPHTDDNRHAHLDSVGIGQHLGREVPSRIDTKSVNAVHSGVINRSLGVGLISWCFTPIEYAWGIKVGRIN
jgi:hypothetical protein